jgi:hypothetical protein
MRDDLRTVYGGEYAGRKYPHEALPNGLELPSTYLEMLARKPGTLAFFLNFSSLNPNTSGRLSSRETFFMMLEILVKVKP